MLNQGQGQDSAASTTPKYDRHLFQFAHKNCLFKCDSSSKSVNYGDSKIDVNINSKISSSLRESLYPKLYASLTAEYGKHRRKWAQEHITGDNN